VQRQLDIATSNDIKLVHWPLMGELLYLVQQGGDWATAVVNRARPSSPVGVVNCCKPAATLETYCSQSLSFVATTPKSNRRRASLKLFFFS